MHRKVQQFRGGLVVKAHGLFVSLDPGLASDREKEEGPGFGLGKDLDGCVEVRVRGVCQRSQRLVQLRLRVRFEAERKRVAGSGFRVQN